MNDKIQLFEKTPIPKAVAKLAIPTILSSLVMVLYNLADTYFVGMVNDPVQNAAVTLAAPVLLAFNAVNNLFGVGSSSMMSRALGRKDYEAVYRSSAFGFYCALTCGVLFSLLCTVIALSLLQIGIKYVGASTAAILTTFEPITSIVCGVILLGETITTVKIIACSLIMIGVVMLSLAKENKNGNISASEG